MLIFNNIKLEKHRRRLRRLLHHIKGKKKRKKIRAEFLKCIMNPGLDLRHKKHRPKPLYPRIKIESKGRDYPNYRPFKLTGKFVPWHTHVKKAVAKTINAMDPKEIKKHIYLTLKPRRPKFTLDPAVFLM